MAHFPSLTPEIEKHIGKIVEMQPCHGGDINKAFRLQTADGGKYFLKTNRADLIEMFNAELAGLNLLRRRSTFRVPKVIDTVQSPAASGLLMEWIEPSQPDDISWQKFWECLAEMHDVNEEKFGLPMDNYIGSLRQQNDEDESWIEFWIERRIAPLMIEVTDKGILPQSDIPSFLYLFDKVRTRFKDHPFKPALLHGDLWKGNLIFDENGHPTVIDPAVYYGWPEMELAFMELFGGFSKQGQEHYKPKASENFLGSDYYMIWQLYPLLVHTILFQGMYKRRLMTSLSHALELL